MKKKAEYRFQVKLGAKEFWLFSMYHANKGATGLFGLIFTVAALFLLVTKWTEVDTSYRILLVVCALMFTVWQPGVLYLKARRQAALPAMQIPVELILNTEGLTVSQKEEQITVSWEQLFQVVELSNMLILYTDSIHAYLLTNAVMGEEKNGLMEMIRANMPKDRVKRRKGIFL